MGVLRPWSFSPNAYYLQELCYYPWCIWISVHTTQKVISNAACLIATKTASTSTNSTRWLLCLGEHGTCEPWFQTDHLQTGFYLVKTCKQSTSWTNNRAHETIVHLSIQSWIHDFERSNLPSHLDPELTKFTAPFEPPISLWQHLRLIRWSALCAAQRGGVLKSHMHLMLSITRVLAHIWLIT